MKLFLGGIGVLSLCAAGAALASDNAKITRTLDLSGFDRIDIAGVYDLEVQVGSDYVIELRGRERDLDRVEASVRNGELRLGKKERERGERRWNFNNQEKGVDARITLPALNGLDVSGVVDGEIRGVDAETFDIDLSGVGDVELEGECGALDANVSGVGDLDAKDLECRSVKINVSGVGGAKVYASEEAEAGVSGMGSIDIYGAPETVVKDGGMFSDITVH